MKRGQQLLVAGAVLGALLTSSAALAENGGVGPVEKWNCTVTSASRNNNQPVQYSLQQGQLIAQPLGAPRYQVLDNTKFGIIAVDRAGDLDETYGLNIYVATVMIDRANGHFSSTLSHSGHTPEFQVGSCSRQDANAGGPTVGAAMVGK